MPDRYRDSYDDDLRMDAETAGNYRGFILDQDKRIEARMENRREVQAEIAGDPTLASLREDELPERMQQALGWDATDEMPEAARQALQRSAQRQRDRAQGRGRDTDPGAGPDFGR